jgi:serine/threonine protein kinase
MNNVCVSPLQVVNIKELAASDNTVDLTEFDNEMEVLTSLSHPNIVNFFGSSIDDLEGFVYQVLELCTGGNVAQYYLTPDFNKQEYFRIALEFLSGVEYLHGKNVSRKFVVACVRVCLLSSCFDCFYCKSHWAHDNFVKLPLSEYRFENISTI